MYKTQPQPPQINPPFMPAKSPMSASPHHIPHSQSQQIPTATNPLRTPSPGQTPLAKSPADSRPDYSRSHFEPLGKNAAPNGEKAKPKTEDIFGDLLGSQGYTFTAKKDNAPRSINEMRKEELATTMDPEKLKILDWVSVTVC